MIDTHECWKYIVAKILRLLSDRILNIFLIFFVFRKMVGKLVSLKRQDEKAYFLKTFLKNFDNF